MKVFIQVRYVILIWLLSSTFSLAPHPWNSKFTITATTCRTSECYDQSDYLNSYMSSTLNPCDDFYEYTCGNWFKKHAYPIYYPEFSVDTEMGEASFDHVRTILQEKVKQKDIRELKQAKEFYRKCADLPYLGLYDGIVIASHVKVLGYFPLFHKEGTHFNKKTWQDVHNYYIGLTSESALFGITMHNKLKYYEPIIHISQIPSPYGLFMPKKAFTVAQLRNYAQLLVKLLKRVITEKSEWRKYSLVEKDIMDVLGFRREIHSIYLEHFASTIRHKVMTVSDLDKWYGEMAEKYKSTAQMSWIAIFRNLFRKTYALERISRTTIDVENRLYLRFLARVLSETPDNVISNHIHLYFIERHLVLDEHLRELIMEMIVENGKLISSVRYLGKRWHVCIATNEAKDSVGAVYVNKYFPLENKKKAEEIVESLKNMIKLQISDSDWLDDYTKRKSRRLIIDMKTAIGYPEYYDDWSKKIEYLESKVIEPGKIDAIYSPYSNRISISAAYLTTPLFDSHLPDAVLFGAIGSRAAHEMYHAFGPDHIERQEKEYYWPQNMLDIYKEKIKCFVDQHDNIPVQELKHIQPVPTINGNTTIDENIADTMGLKLSYDAFRKKLWLLRKCQTLPNLHNIDCLQLFFISFAMSFCSAMTPDTLMEQVETGIYSTPRLRVNMAVSNMKEFSSVFKCSLKSPMNPEKKCYMWN